MKVYISADMEGVAGVAHFDEVTKGKQGYAEFQVQMTAEVKAACEGAVAAGAEEIWVKDAHDSGRNLIISDLPKPVRIIREWSGHPLGMMQEIDETFDAAIMIGYHSRSGGGESPLEHTLSSDAIYLSINDKPVTEFVTNAYAAAMFGVPVVFVSGDEGVCEEVQDLDNNIARSSTIKGVGASTISVHPQLAVERIEKAVEQALSEDLSRCQIELPEQFEIEVRFRRSDKAYRGSFYPGASLSDPLTLRFQAEDYFDVLRFFLFAVW